MYASTATQVLRRSRKGAWIEIIPHSDNARRGQSRSREGAWIEIVCSLLSLCHLLSRSREGAWIEILTRFSASSLVTRVAPVRERGLKFLNTVYFILQRYVAPVRERGLKFLCLFSLPLIYRRSREGAWIEMVSPQCG